MILRVPTDAASFQAMADANRDVMKGIAERGRERGAIHHAFYEGDGEVLIVDEWESQEAFEGFFQDEAANIGPLMAEAGVEGQPGPATFHRKFETGDAF